MSILQSHLIAALADVMELPPTQVSPTKSFTEQGVDSLTALRLARKIHDRTGIEIELEWFLDYPNILELERFLGEQTPSVPAAVPEQAGDVNLSSALA
jgi:acyl carrier protein